jgi:hypothetical protein
VVNVIPPLCDSTLPKLRRWLLHTILRVIKLARLYRVNLKPFGL